MGFEKGPSQIKFNAWQKPVLEPGKYQVTLTQTLSKVKEGENDAVLYTTKNSKTFFVAGERFRLAPAEIGGVFPPAYSLGKHNKVFPHIMINRSTLPWERKTNANDKTPTPWLALLVIYEKEQKDVVSEPAKLGDVKDLLNMVKFPEPGQEDDDTVQVLRIKKELLENILPAKNDLRWLTHVREGDDTNFAVLIANRLPPKNGVSTVYLVSLENRYKEGENGLFDFDAINKAGEVNFVQFHSWSFTCTGEAAGDFSTILNKLNHNPSTLRLPDSKLPDNNPNLKYLQQGFYPLPHKLREGSQTVSWYHGPLAPAPVEPVQTGPVTCADSLLHYYEDNGMFNVSYAAAWELGRLLALQNAHYSTELYKWKKQYGRSKRKASQMQIVPHLPGANRDHSPAAVPDSVDHWLKELALLKGIPFNYLVPDEELLPAESIRFFRLNTAWVQALLDGALSIGRVTRNDHELDKEMIKEEELLADKTVTGFILRSQVVAGWPGLQVEGFGNDKLVILRNETLSSNVRLCLFEGELNTLSLHLKPDMLHFGVDEDPKRGYTKKWRKENGEEDDNTVITVPFDNGKLQVNGLLKNYADRKKPISSSAHLAVQLLEGVACVRFEV